MAIDHIVFDIGRVLLHWDADLIYTDLIPDPAEREDFLTNVCSMAWNIEQDRGRDWTVAEDLLIADHPDKEDLIRAYRPNWERSIPYAYQDVGELLAELMDAGKDVTMLTNFNQETYKIVEKKYEVLRKPRGVTVSGDVKLIKPDRAIYDHHTKAFDLNTERTVFIDDSLNNIEAACAYGWQAIHFTGEEGADKLRGQLSALAVTT